MSFRNFIKSQLISEAKMLDISIKGAHKVLTNDAKINEFLNSENVVEEKLDGIKVTAFKVANNKRLDDWIISYKHDILHDDEFSYMSDADIKKSSIASAQFKFVIEHFKKIVKGTGSIPVNTELFIEYLMNKPTLSSSYKKQHGMVLIGHSKAKHRVSGNKLFTTPMGFFTNERDKYAKIMGVDVPAVLFKGKFNSQKEMDSGIIEPKMKKLFDQRKGSFHWDIPELLIDDLHNLLIEIESKYGGDMEGVVCQYKDNFIKFQKEGQVDPEARMKIKMKYKEDNIDDENSFWDNIRSSALEIIDDLDRTKPINVLLREISKRLSSYNVPFTHSKKNEQQIIDDIQGNCKMIIAKQLEGQNGSLISGRFQPFTNGHKKMFDEAFSKTDYVVVNIVKGKKSDVSRNPYPIELQEELIKATFPTKNIEFVSTTSGSLITIMNKAEQNINVIWCGSDRYNEYKKQVERNPDISVEEIKRTDNDISATKVRQSIIDNDIVVFKTLVPKETHDYFKTLRDYLVK
jgi:nicotinamide mononucleotide adenylyltransferase